MADRQVELAAGDAIVRLVIPGDAQFAEVDGLGPEQQSHVWRAPGGFFSVAAGGGDGFRPDGLVAGERERAEAFELISDEPVPALGEGARRIAFRSTHRIPRSADVRATGERIDRDEELQTRVGDFLFVEGVRLGYRVDPDAPARASFARALDLVEVIG